jgi:hypothetical protein
MKRSPNAADDLMEAAQSGEDDEAEDLMGTTDCPHGCYVEPDGVCPHDYESAARTAGVI